MILFVFGLAAFANALDETDKNCRLIISKPPINDGCPPGFVGKYPDCRGEGYLPLARPPELVCTCPPPLIGKYPNCHERCPQHQIGVPPNCKPIACRTGWIGDYEPNCRFISCPHGQIGTPPNCHTPHFVEFKHCTDGLIGTYPDCHKPCPKYMYRKSSNSECAHIDCPIGVGWVGKFQPNCTYTPSCPSNTQGIWPSCSVIYCPENTIGTYPNCKCKPGANCGEQTELKPITISTTKLVPIVTTTSTEKVPIEKRERKSPPTIEPIPITTQKTTTLPISTKKQENCPLNTIGVYPNCKCKSGYKGIPPDCNIATPGPAYLPVSNEV